MILQPMLTWANDNGSCGDNVTYTYDEATHTLSILGNGDMTNYSSFNSKSPWYNYRGNIENLVIGNDVTSIGNYSFYECVGLKSIVWGSSIVRIGTGAFLGCTGLVSVDIPDNVQGIYNEAFENCSSLVSVVIGNGVTTIGDKVFLSCTNMKDLSIGDNVTSFGSGVFWGCSSLTSFIFPSGIKTISNQMLAYCSGLTSIDIPNGVTIIGSQAFSGCTGLVSVNIPNSITTIESAAFHGCKGLTTVAIPNSVNTIMSGAFNHCDGLTSVHISDLEAWCNIYFDDLTSNPLAFAHHLFLNGNAIHELIIPNTITTIRNYAFIGCNSLTSISIPSSITSIGDYSFQECNWITSIEIPNGVKTIGRNAFAKCSGLTTVYFPRSLTTIDYMAFFYCNSLSEVYCYSENVPEMKYSTYETSDIVNADLYVPASTIDQYKNTVPWSYCKNFYSIEEFKLTYIVDNETYKLFNIHSGKPINSIETPIKEGYTFSGWSEIPETMPAHDVTITGTFTINKYKLIYKVDGAEYKSYELDYGAAITPELAPTKEGYTFSGWSEIPETMPAHDVTVTGTFAINKYKLAYVVDGEEYKLYELEFGTTITPEPAPTKEGYTFSGWSDIPKTMPAHDVTVMGSFTKGAYILTYMVDGEIYKTMSYDYGATITPEPAPTKEGYTFSGWSEIPETMPAHDVTVTGTFAINKYKLTYVIDGEEYKSYELEYGATITPEPAPTKEGYTFSGWSEIPETMPAHDVTVTGSFAINKYKLTFIVDGEEYKSYELEYGASITPEPTPTKEGYTFSGWSDIPETMPAHDVTVTGSFTVNQYTITYIINDEVYTTQTVDYGSTIIPPAAPEREGYDFAWADYPETMPAYDITIYGTYTTGIEAIMAGEANCQIFSLDGKPLNELQKGVNIVRMSNGQIRKVVVR